MSAARTGSIPHGAGFYHKFGIGAGREIRLGSVQRARLAACAEEPQRGCPRNPSFVRLKEEAFVTGAQHISARTGRPTTDHLYTITEEGRRYLRVGRDR